MRAKMKAEMDDESVSQGTAEMLAEKQLGGRAFWGKGPESPEL